MSHTSIQVIFCLTAWVSTAAAAPPPQPVGTLVDVGGYRVHLYCTGTGSPVVVVVGGAFSFDWGLVQPGVSQFTRICTYAPSGTAWSDPPPPQHQNPPVPLCIDRVEEIHRLLQNAPIPEPYVLVGFSIGGLISRLYTNKYPDTVAGLVIVDHAFTDVDRDASGPPQVPSAKTSLDAPGSSTNSAPVLIFAPPITLGLEDDENFRKLPVRNQYLHRWAMSQHPLRSTSTMADECAAALDRATQRQAHPLGNRPLVVIRTNNDTGGYAELQAQLLQLSSNSREVVAGQSSHMVIIDEPDLVIRAIRETVNAVKSTAH